MKSRQYTYPLVAIAGLVLMVLFYQWLFTETIFLKPEASPYVTGATPPNFETWEPY